MHYLQLGSSSYSLRQRDAMKNHTVSELLKPLLTEKKTSPVLKAYIGANENLAVRLTAAMMLNL